MTPEVTDTPTSPSVPLNECLIAWSTDVSSIKVLSPDFEFLGAVETNGPIKCVLYNDNTDELLTGGLGELGRVR